LDQFKLINDTCGHAAGDAVLCRFAALVRREAPRGAILARIGADEIAVLLERASAEFSLALAERVVAALHAESFDWEEHTLELGAHAVVLPLAEAGLTSRDILIAIDAARLSSRGCGSSRVRLCHPNGHETAIARGEMRWVPRLTKALAEDRLRLFAQPAMALGQAPGGGYVEILARLEGESGELVMPGEFIAAAERFQRIRAIDRRIVVQSLRLLDDAGVEHDGVFAINLSGHSIGDGEFLAAVLDALDTYPRIPPHKLCFEITETAAVANFAEAHQFMNALRQRGCRFALDDFGAGLSSFAYLKSLPVDYLKIDGRFVRDIAGSPTDHSIVDAVHRVGRAMGMRTIAESVESDAALDAVRAIGADYAQGFQCARPQPLQDVLAAMRAHSVGSLH
jgi:diguanylate cyclase (GGDEF)-like protein